MEGQVEPDGLFLRGLVPGEAGPLDAAEGGRGAAETGVSQAGVVVVQLPDGEGVRRLAGKEIVQVLLCGTSCIPNRARKS